METMTPLVGSPAPNFSMPCIDARSRSPRSISLADFRGRWLILLFYPRDFSFVCPTELSSFNGHIDEFQSRNSDIVGVSIDSIASHDEWLHTPIAEGGLGTLLYPLASDTDGEVSRSFGVWDPVNTVSMRGLFIIDPIGLLQYAVVHNLNVGRNVKEILRVLDALQTEGLCPASWTSADGTIDPEKGLQPGRVLGHYRIRKHLGTGTFGSVFSAWDLQLQRPVALKVLKRDISESRADLLKEARTAAKLNHPNVCTVHAVEEDNGLPVIVMELIDGRSLNELIAEGLDVKDALGLAHGIAKGIASAHARSVIHGDLKPTNVIVSSSGIPKILDFGLARTQMSEGTSTDDAGVSNVGTHSTASDINSAGDSDKTVIVSSSAARECDQRMTDSIPTIAGTPAYMSPEQATGQCGTTAGDVFSYGLLFYELLTGQRALPEDSVVKVLTRLKSSELPDQLADGVPVEFRSLLRAMLDTHADRRPSMSSIIDAISAIRHG